MPPHDATVVIVFGLVYLGDTVAPVAGPAAIPRRSIRRDSAWRLGCKSSLMDNKRCFRISVLT
jgi:hypothetical protein